MRPPAATVVVPTHDHASTLDLAVESALAQSVADLEVVVLGDGVGDDTRDVVRRLCAADERVRFVDRPKGPSRNEQARHEVVLSSLAPVVTYLGDDDLLLPHHVEVMIDLLASHDFAHPFPVFVEPDGHLTVMPTDLSDDECVQWHLSAPTHNTVSLTGATHTIDLYRRLPHGWRPAPPGRWSDHYMWEQVFQLPGVRLATARRSTTLKLATTARQDTDRAARRDELLPWSERIRAPGFVQEWDTLVEEAARRGAIEEHRQLVCHSEALRAEQEARARAETEREAVRDQLAAIEGTRTWRARSALVRHRVLRRLLAREPRP